MDNEEGTAASNVGGDPAMDEDALVEASATSTPDGGGGGAALADNKEKVFATEKQLCSVFSRISLEMEQSEEMPFASGVENEGMVDEGAGAAGASTRTTTNTIQGEATAAVNEVTKVYATEEQIRSVFLNRVIADKIMSYLNFGDMKAARQVSRTFLGITETCKRFKDSQVLLFTKDKYPLSDQDLSFLDAYRIWCGIRINVCFKSEQLQKIPRHILENVKFVSLVSEGLDLIAPELIASIQDVLNSTLHVSHVQFDVRLFCRDLKEVFSSSTVKENLKDLKRLDILNPDNNCHTTFNFMRDSSFFQDFYHPIFYELYKEILRSNFNQLPAMFQRLESFHMLKMKMRFNFRDLEFEICEAIYELLYQNRETLKKLSLHLSLWKEGIGLPTLPQLNSFTVTLPTWNYQSSKRLKDFLADHPSLEELDVSDDKAGFSLSLLYGIKEHCPNLRKLHLKAIYFVDSESEVYERKVDWTFLKSMTRLKDFQISRPNCFDYKREWYGNGIRLLQALPRHQLERLSFRGIGVKCGFWKQDDDLEGEPDLAFKLELLHGFRNLRRLSFYRCRDAVDDNIIRFIQREMTSLEVLEISHCSRLTDAGLAGTFEDGSDSIRNIKGLKKLSIKSCSSVNPEGISSCVKFQFLRYFQYFDEISVSKSFVLQIMAQNPSLESLAVNLDCPVWVVLEEVNNINSRLTKLIRLYDGDDDSDSDADSGSGYAYQRFNEFNEDIEYGCYDSDDWE